MNDDFLRNLADRAIPDVTVHTDQVIPRAHHRRRIIRTTQTVGVVATLAIIGGGITWAWTDRPEPARPPQPTVTSSPTPTPAPSPNSTPTPTRTPDSAASAPPVSADEVSAELPYWHLTAEAFGGSWVASYQSWNAWDQPGILTSMDLNDGATRVQTQESILTFTIDEQRDAGPLPTDAASMLERVTATALSLEGDSSESQVAYRLGLVLLNSDTAPSGVRLAAFDALRDSPGTTVELATDRLGRSGTSLTYEASDGTTRLIVDPHSGRVLQSESLDQGGGLVYTGEAVAAPPLPIPESGGPLGD